jgi:ATP-binding cassette subfamily F protein 3
MLTVSHLTKNYDLQSIFEDISFNLNPSERVGLVGPNGCGKTTLLRILMGEEVPDGGTISRDPDLRLGYLSQGFTLDPQATLGEIIGARAGDPAVLETDLTHIAESLGVHPDDPALQLAYDDLIRRIQFAETGRASAILAGLGLSDIDPQMPVQYLSGGQKTRLLLALVLLSEPQLLLLDEPTNHLDITMLEWLEGWLNSCPCGALIVSHDRTFLDHSVTRILEMDIQQHSLREYAGNYSDYVKQRQVEIDRQWSAYRDQQEEIKRMKADIARVKQQAAYTERQASSIRIGGGDFKIKGYKSYQQGIAKKVAKKAKSRERKLEHYLESDERVGRPQSTWSLKLDFAKPVHRSHSVIHMEQLSVGYHAEHPLLNDLTLDVHAGQRIVITGPNGAGKTTLLRTLAGEIPPLAGEVRLGSSQVLGYLTQDQSDLEPERSVVETLESYFPTHTEVRSFLAKFLFSGDEPLKLVGLLSYGQRTRLMLARLIAGGATCLLLDEPINHLDIPSRTQFEQALGTFEGAVLAVVHDRYFIDRFAQQVWWVENGGIRIEHRG